jgi:hypothetical protein
LLPQVFFRFLCVCNSIFFSVNRSGEALRMKRPQWHWFFLFFQNRIFLCSFSVLFRCAGLPDKAVPYLPKDKQFLEIKGVPCKARAASVTQSGPDTTAEGDEWAVAGGLSLILVILETYSTIPLQKRKHPHQQQPPPPQLMMTTMDTWFSRTLLTLFAPFTSFLILCFFSF